MTEPLSLDVKYVLICDDIRREDNGKLILIGVYTSDISVAQFPVALTLSFFVHALPSRIGDGDLFVRLIAGEAEFMNNRAPISFTNMNDGVLNLSGVPVFLQQATDLELQIKAAETDEWRTIKSFSVKKPDSSRPTVMRTLVEPA